MTASDPDELPYRYERRGRTPLSQAASRPGSPGSLREAGQVDSRRANFAGGFSTRVGLEDGSILPDRSAAPSNAELVKAAVQIAYGR
jgi:beta-keto acid cleavage enzyme